MPLAALLFLSLPAPLPALQEPGLGITPTEVQRVLQAPPYSPLWRMRVQLDQRAKLGYPTLDIEPGKHVSTKRKIRAGYVSSQEAMPLGFLMEYNERVDALGLQYLLTGDQRYADRVGEHIRSWDPFSPPFGLGREEGGEPSIMHRNFYGLLRGVYNAWPGLDRAARASAVAFCRILQDRLQDWWEHTDWIRGNHAAASNQTGLYAALVLAQAARTDPDLVSRREAGKRLQRFVITGLQFPADSAILRSPPLEGLVGFERQVQTGILNEDNRAIYVQRYPEAATCPEGESLDFLYKPSNQRMEYHLLVMHHLMLTYWVLVRNGLDQELLDDPAEVRRQIERLVDYTRPYFETGQLLPGATGDSPDPTRDRRTREILSMAVRIFPDKLWIQPILDAGRPYFTEMYSAACDPF